MTDGDNPLIINEMRWKRASRDVPSMNSSPELCFQHQYSLGIHCALDYWHVDIILKAIMNASTPIPKYVDSHALVIGINEYKFGSPLMHAASDAQSIADTLKDNFGFQEKNICLLINKDATRSSIYESFLSFASGGTNINDRVVVFFAGHGHTEPSHRSEVGYLVPCDGDPNNLASLLRWDDLTRNADLIDAKHILFLMDACYGGLAITRALKPGSMRFLKNMLLRRARQVLTAGKADEVVADSGGPLPDHSVFTGHLLEGLKGKAADTNGLITANGLMAYVYQEVGSDSDSHQTPHYGHLNGDGDMIISEIKLSKEQEDQQKDEDILVSVPIVLPSKEDKIAMTIVEQTKEFLAEERYKIKLHDLINGQIQEVLSATAEDHFAIQGSWSPEDFIERINKYETVTDELCKTQALLAFWGTEIHRDTLILPTKKICGRLKPESGLSVWINLRLYPALLLLYAGGIAAVAKGQYDNLQALMQTAVPNPERQREEVSLVRGVLGPLTEIAGAFKALPDHKNNYAPRSEYLFKLMQPIIDDLLFLGADYESHFDRFEVILALEYAEQYASSENGRVWGPPGRFAWKSSRDSGPLYKVMKEAESQGEYWHPIRAGLFGGSIDRFKEIASEYKKLVDGFGWR